MISLRKLILPAGRMPDATWYALLVQALEERTILKGVNMRLGRSRRGVAISGKPGGGVASNVSEPDYPFKPYLSPWKGVGTDPHAADRTMRVGFLRGMVNGRTPTNMVAEFVCFGSPTDSTIKEEDAVVTKFYLEIPIAETSTGSGDLQTEKPTIMSVEGAPNDDLIDLVSPPTFGTGGALPPYVIYPICEMLYWGGSLHFSPGITSYLSMALVLTGVSSSGGIRGIQFSRT